MNNDQFWWKFNPEIEILSIASKTCILYNLSWISINGMKYKQNFSVPVKELKQKNCSSSSHPGELWHDLCIGWKGARRLNDSENFSWKIYRNSPLHIIPAALLYIYYIHIFISILMQVRYILVHMIRNNITFLFWFISQNWTFSKALNGTDLNVRAMNVFRIVWLCEAEVFPPYMRWNRGKPLAMR